jgi:deoxyadenosine/deoxycytidine kinase
MYPTVLPNVFLKFVSVHGNIAGGKSTLLAAMQTADVPVVMEDIDAWKDVNGFNLLDLYYKDPRKYGFAFQMEVMRSRCEDIYRLAHDVSSLERLGRTDVWSRNPDNGKIVRVRYVFCERDFFSCVHVFGQHLMNNGALEPVMMEELQKSIDTSRMPIPSYVIYINTPFDHCVDRMNKRSRTEEKHSSEDMRPLLADLDRLYQEWMDTLEHTIPYTVDGPVGTSPVRVVRYDGTYGLHQLGEVVEEILDLTVRKERMTALLESLSQTKKNVYRKNRGGEINIEGRIRRVQYKQKRRLEDGRVRRSVTIDVRDENGKLWRCRTSETATTFAWIRDARYMMQNGHRGTRVSVHGTIGSKSWRVNVAEVEM